MAKRLRVLNQKRHHGDRDAKPSARTASSPAAADHGPQSNPPIKPKSNHPIDVANVTLPPELAKSRYGKWRAMSLVLVYVLMIVHIMHWKVAGRTMAPLELSEIMKALELRVLSAGVIFIGIMLIGSLIFGRFFCSWGCHMLALQDLSHWILKKLRIRPRPIRSRVMLLIPVGAATYMFLWPQIKRMWHGWSLPPASSRLTTTDFWRDLPGPLVITLTALTCGFLIVYFFGGRGFCTYGCPYGVLFGLFDRLAPGKIRVGPGCQQCGRCTAICTSNVRVHEEVKAYGMVVNPRCMKDLDCVSVCPQNALHYKFGLPSIARSRKNKPQAPRYDFTIIEEAVLAVTFLVALYTWRGLYDKLPFLMSLALSGVTAYVVITFGRLLSRPHLAFNRYNLKIGGKLLRPGYAFVVAGAAFLALALHSTFIQYNRKQGDALLLAADALTGLSDDVQAEKNALLERSARHLERCYRYGLASTVSLELNLGTALLGLDRPAEAETFLRRVLARKPNYPDARMRLASALTQQNKLKEADEHLAYALEIRAPHEEYEPQFQHLHARIYVQRGSLLAKAGNFQWAEQQYRQALAIEPDKPEAHFGLGVIAAQSGRLEEAVAHYRESLRLRPDAAEAHANLGDVLVAQGKPAEALDEYNAALAADPATQRAHFKIGVLSLHMEKLDDALAHFARAVEVAPTDFEAHNYFGQALLEAGRFEEARARFERAVELNDQFADAHFNLARLCASAGQREDADRHLRRAAQLDPRYLDRGRSVAPSGQ